MKKPSDRQAKIDRGTRTPVGLAVLADEGTHMTCSCGWLFLHGRRKVRENAAQKHLDKDHHGMGIWV